MTLADETEDPDGDDVLWQLLKSSTKLKITMDRSIGFDLITLLLPLDGLKLSPHRPNSKRQA